MALKAIFFNGKSFATKHHLLSSFEVDCVAVQIGRLLVVFCQSNDLICLTLPNKLFYTNNSIS